MPSGTPGFTVDPAYDKLGWHSSDTHGLSFDDCRVPEANLLGSRGRGFQQFLAILDDGRIAISALAVGLAQACLDESLRYATTRHTFGAPIGSRQAVAFAISDLAVALDAARLLTYKAAWLKDAGRPRRRGEAGRGEGQAVLVRGGGRGDPDRHPGLRRLRVHGGVSGGALLPGRQGPGDR